MQINTYISEKDFETLCKAKPGKYKSVPSFMADIIRQRAQEEERRAAQFDATGLPFTHKRMTTEDVPIIPQYERQ